MNEMSSLSKTLRPMTIGDILDWSVQLYKSNFARFIGIILLVKVPYLVLETYLTRSMESYATESSYLPLLLAELLEPLFVVPIITAAMTIAISELFLGRDIKVFQAYSKLSSRFLPLFGTILLSGAIIAVGFLILIVPGLIFWIWLAFIPQTVVIDGEGGVSAMKRSRYLVRGHTGKTFVLLVLIFLAASLVKGMISLGIARFLPLPDEYSGALGAGVANVVSVLFEPFKVAAMILLYYDFRIRKEGFDLEIMAAELEADNDYSV